MIRNILFDMGQVLIRWVPEDLLKARNITGEDAEELLRELFREWEWVALDAGAITPEDAVKSVCARVSPHLHTDVEYYITSWWKLPFIENPGMHDLVKTLKENGYHIYLLSNASIYQKDYCERIPGSEYFEGRVTSSEVGMLKPDREIFRYICRKYDLKAEECCFIDDGPANVFAAMQEGMTGIVYHQDKDHLYNALRKHGIRI